MIKKISLLIIPCLISITLFAQEISPRYELVRLSDAVNDRYNQVSPVISPDGKNLYYFVSDHPENTYGKVNSQDIWVSTLDEKGNWSKGKHMGTPFNQNRFNQVFNFMPDGSLFIRGGRSKNDPGFSLVSLSGSWRELRVVDFDKMYKGIFYGATLSGDGRHMIIYFSEKAGDRSSDLYLSNLQPDGYFSKPVKLKISSAADDFAPFIGPDQKTLFFATNRYNKDRVGGIDVYRCTRLDDTWENWSDPANLGRAINTPSDDAYFSIDEKGNIFTARAGASIDGGNFDLLILKPRNVHVLIAGTVFNQKTRQPINGASVEITYKDQKQPTTLKTPTSGRFDSKLPEVDGFSVSASANGFVPANNDYKVPRLVRDTTMHIEIYLTPIAKQLMLAGDVIDKKTNSKIPASKINISTKENPTPLLPATAGGSYSQDIPGLGWYFYNVSAEGYLNSTDSVQVINENVIPVKKNIYMTKIEVGVTVRLKNIYFDFDKTTLKEESFIELNKVVELLRQNPTVAIEIAGHTDGKGSEAYNLTLSQGRSQSVVDYLVSQGIESSRLQAHGYGKSKPIDTNDTDEGRANNRRVEFTVLKM
ncbi:MAG: Outer membrane lipoprotein omp16 precursor [Cytophagales bacterium]|jgi:outer membrane protein OmpA-like peptidoglycan-associated protein/Tol biopolymer transport system component|nr:OmpA family protein [Bacteroidota bacterium]MBS1980522.1 OmpA family protein [Bacteroidota bacterium]WHZ07840.1 MAG: Outer membrane lipoprotein omp16 precursor [Cytophagales bacterium]